MTEYIFAVMNVETYKESEKTLKDIEKLPKKKKETFCQIIDECFLENQDDPEMKESFDVLDKLARKMKITVYELIFSLYDEEEFEARINTWKKEKGL